MKTFLFALTNTKKELKENSYLILVVLHIILGIFIYLSTFFSKVYALTVILFGIFFVVRNQNRNNEVLYVIAYIVGCDVLLRSTGGSPNYEFAKYSMFAFAVLGLFYSGFSRKGYIYCVFLGLLIPSIVLALLTIDTDVRQKIIFDIAGPICLGVCSLYTYQKKITIPEIHNILIAIGLPIIATSSYLLLKCPAVNISSYITSTESNYDLSGGYAPNQIATILGLGIFIFYTRLFLIPSTKRVFIVNLMITGYIYYRGLLSFSRGGMITGLAVIGVFMFLVFIHSKYYADVKSKLTASLAAFAALFFLTSYQTDDLLLKRYADKNPSGVDKPYETNGRQDLAMEEINLFKENPVLGIGVGEGKEIRESKHGVLICSHNEITRMLAEHGSFGFASMMILISVPLLLFIENRHNFYLLSFFAFWFLTINHSGMRIAAPAFLYALTLLNIDFGKREPVLVGSD